MKLLSSRDNARNSFAFTEVVILANYLLFRAALFRAGSLDAVVVSN